MARGVNKVILVGNLGKDPEVRYGANGNAVANATLATSESWKDKTSGEKQEKTEWHKLVFFGKTAEIAGQYLKKGAQIYVEGKLQTRKWQNKEGADQYTTEVVVSEMQMLGSRPTGTQEATAPEVQTESAGGGGGGAFDDDIPFAQYERGFVA